MMEKQQKRLIALEKELRAASLREKKYVKEMRERGVAPGGWKQKLESRIPERVRTGLESAFTKAFSLVFTRGRGVIELGYNKESILEDHAILDFAFRTKCGRRELREIGRSAARLTESELLSHIDKSTYGTIIVMGAGDMEKIKNLITDT